MRKRQAHSFIFFNRAKAQQEPRPTARLESLGQSGRQSERGGERGRERGGWPAGLKSAVSWSAMYLYQPAINITTLTGAYCVTEVQRFYTYLGFRHKSVPQTESGSWCLCCNTFIHGPNAHNMLCCALLVMIKSKGQSVRGESLLAHHEPLLLHPAVLKPYFHLLVAQVQSVWQLLALLSVDELIHHEFILKFSQLWLRVRLSLLARSHLWRAPWGTWRGAEVETGFIQQQ